MDKKKNLDVLKKIGNSAAYAISAAFFGLLGASAVSDDVMPVEKTTVTVTKVDDGMVTTDKGVFYCVSDMKDVFNLAANKSYDIAAQKQLFGLVNNAVIKNAAPVCP